MALDPSLYKPLWVSLPYEDLEFTFPSRIAFQASFEGWILVRSMTLICPACLKQWACLIFEGDSTAWPQPQPCRDCTLPPSGREYVPGSLLIDYSWGAGLFDTELLEGLPPELLRREVELHLRVAD